MNLLNMNLLSIKTDGYIYINFKEYSIVTTCNISTKEYPDNIGYIVADDNEHKFLLLTKYGYNFLSKEEAITLLENFIIQFNNEVNDLINITGIKDIVSLYFPEYINIINNIKKSITLLG